MYNPTIHILINQARTEDLHRVAQRIRQQRTAALTNGRTGQRTTPRSIRLLIRHQLDAAASSDAVAAASQPLR